MSWPAAFGGALDLGELRTLEQLLRRTQAERLREVHARKLCVAELKACLAEPQQRLRFELRPAPDLLRCAQLCQRLER